METRCADRAWGPIISRGRTVDRMLPAVRPRFLARRVIAYAILAAANGALLALAEWRPR